MIDFKNLKDRFKEIPFLKYVLGILFAAFAVLIIQQMGIKDGEFPYVTMLIFFAFMVLMFVFSSALKSKDPILRFSGYILVYATIIATCVSAAVLLYNAFSINTSIERIVSLTGILKVNNKVPEKDSIAIDHLLEVKDIITPFTGTYNLRMPLEQDSLFPFNGLISLILIPIEGDAWKIRDLDLNKYNRNKNIIFLNEINIIPDSNIAEIKDSIGNVIESIEIIKVPKILLRGGSDRLINENKIPATDQTKDSLNVSPDIPIKKEPIKNKTATVLERNSKKEKEISPVPIPNELKNETKNEYVEPKQETGNSTDIEQRIQSTVKKKEIYKQNEVDNTPVPINLGAVRSSLFYPFEAKQEGIEGKVTVSVLVDVDGSVSQVGKLIGPDIFYDEVLNKVMNLRFVPAAKDGNKVKCWSSVSFNFALNAKDKMK
jgi:outer membrane biosynthesis protein TonB